MPLRLLPLSVLLNSLSAVPAVSTAVAGLGSSRRGFGSVAAGHDAALALAASLEGSGAAADGSTAPAAPALMSCPGVTDGGLLLIGVRVIDLQRQAAKAFIQAGTRGSRVAESGSGSHQIAALCVVRVYKAEMEAGLVVFDSVQQVYRGVGGGGRGNVREGASAQHTCQVGL